MNETGIIDKYVKRRKVSATGRRNMARAQRERYARERQEKLNGKPAPKWTEVCEAVSLAARLVAIAGVDGAKALIETIQTEN